MDNTHKHTFGLEKLTGFTYLQGHGTLAIFFIIIFLLPLKCFQYIYEQKCGAMFVAFGSTIKIAVRTLIKKCYFDTYNI